MNRILTEMYGFRIIPVSPGAGCNDTEAGQCGGTSK